MTLTFDRIEAEALALPPAERAALAHHLIASLDEEPDDEPGDVALAWETEIRRRLDAYRAGVMETVPSAEVFAKARDRLRSR